MAADTVVARSGAGGHDHKLTEVQKKIEIMNARACLLIFRQTVIPRLDRGIQCFQVVMDPRVKPACLPAGRPEDDNVLWTNTN